ncbi:MAG: sulfite oxidase heme-binding subunit YedZ [Gammaproteobacteria bacterium]
MRYRLAWPAPWLFGLGLLPLLRIIYLGVAGELGANPIEFITRSTGTWALVGLLLTLAVTPLRRLTGWTGLMRHRRTLGLFAFFYACLHALAYVWLDQFFDPAAILHDIVKRPFVTAGFAAFTLLVPLAMTSTRAMMRRLGHRWSVLHRLIYPAALLGVVHFLWLVKKDLTEPLAYAVVLVLLLALRLPWGRRALGAIRGQ